MGPSQNFTDRLTNVVGTRYGALLMVLLTPVSAPTRTLSALQGVVAQLYVAIIIARTVGMVPAHRRNGPIRT